MRSKLVSVAIGATFAIALLGATGASAATEFGDTCSGDSPVPSPYTLTTLSTGPGTLPLRAPISGVITKVKMQLSIPIPITIPEQVKLLRPAGGNSFTVTSQAEVKIGPEVTVTDVRLPVQAGEQLALRGLPFTYMGTDNPGFSFYCKELDGKVGAVAEDLQPGATAEFTEGPTGRLPVAAVIEPDADNDGYGDETQDGCTVSAAVHEPCPLIGLDALALAGKSSVAVYVTSDREGAVEVGGVASLGKGKKAKLKAGPKPVSAGKFVRFNLKFTPKLKKRLKELPKDKKLTLKVSATATNVAGLINTDQVTVKLKGQG